MFKTALKKSLASMGWQVRRIPRKPMSLLFRNSGKDDPEYLLYQPVTPQANYCPWTRDESFLQTYAAVENHTLVDLLRCFELWSLVGHATKLQGSLIEIGVWRGGTGALIAQKAALHNSGKKIYLCDTFKGVVKASGKDPHYYGGEHADTSRPIVESLLASLRLNNVRILEGIFPDETSHLVADEQFAFCHIDVDVYESAKDIVTWMWPRMLVGGVIVYDDYGFFGCEGITSFVEEQACQPDRIVLYNLNGHAVVMKIK
jgi:O-methyltransferase